MATVLNYEDSQEEGRDFLRPFAEDLCTKRSEAVRKRKASGIERVWDKARKQYQGMDERNSYAADKSETLDGPIVTSYPRGSSEESRSTVFLNITRPYTNAGTARVSDIYLPTGKMPWSLKKTPISDVSVLMSAVAEFPIIGEIVSQDPEMVETFMASEEEAEEAMRKAELQIKDWLKENRWMGEMRLLIKEMGQVGTGVLKGPSSKKKRRINEKVEMVLAQLPPDIQRVLRVRMMYSPSSKCVKVENFYPDPACGTDIQNGGYTWEKVPDVSERELRGYMDDKEYFADQIKLCLEEGAKNYDGKEKDPSKNSPKPFDLWIYQGMIDLRVLAGQGKGGMEEGEDRKGPMAFGSVILCNERVIKISPDLLEQERFSYDVAVWEERENSWAGIGIPEQIETPQRGLNSSLRALMDNLGYSVGPQVIERKGLIEPVDGNPTLYPYKRWIANFDDLTSSIDDVKKALTFLEFPNYTGEIMPVIQFWLKMAEDTTSLPLLLQGQSSTEAVGVSQQLQNNATTNLRLIVKELDDKIVTPHISRYYEWTQLYGPPEVKGDAVPEALGSSTLITRELQNQALIQVLDRFVQPVYGKSPKKGMDAFLEGQQLDPEKFDLDDEEREMLTSAEQRPDPSVEVAQIRAEVDKFIAELKAQVDREKIQSEEQKEGLRAQTNRDSAETNASAAIATEDMRQEGQTEREVMKEEDRREEKREERLEKRMEEKNADGLVPGEVPNVPVEDMEIDPDEAMRVLGF